MLSYRQSRIIRGCCSLLTAFSAVDFFLEASTKFYWEKIINFFHVYVHIACEKLRHYIKGKINQNNILLILDNQWIFVIIYSCAFTGPLQKSWSLNLQSLFFFICPLSTNRWSLNTAWRFANRKWSSGARPSKYRLWVIHSKRFFNQELDGQSDHC